MTHGANISALTGISPAQGELLVITPGEEEFTVRGRLAPVDGE